MSRPPPVRRLLLPHTHPLRLRRVSMRLAPGLSHEAPWMAALLPEDLVETLAETLAPSVPFDAMMLLVLDEEHPLPVLRLLLPADGYVQVDRVSGPLPAADGAAHYWPAGEDTAHTWGLPLFFNGFEPGVLVLRRTSRPFSAREVQRLATLSRPLAAAVENTRMYAKSQAQAKRAFLLNRLALAIQQNRERGPLLETVVQALGPVLGVSRCLVLLQERPDDPLVIAAQYTLASTPPWTLPDGWSPPETPFSSSLAGEALGVAWIPVSLPDSGPVGGLLLQQCDAVRHWTADDRALLSAVADHLGMALQQTLLLDTLRHQKAHLEDTLRELQETQLHLLQSEKLAVLGQLVAGIAHEVNTPLATVRGNTQTLETCLERLRPSLPGPMAETMTQLLGLNRLACDRMNEVVQQLRQFARLPDSQRQWTDLNEDLKTTLLLLRASVPSHLRLQTRLAPDLPRLWAFPALLQQVVMNLLVNAIQALADDPGEVTLETRADEAGGGIWIEVHDTGPGIPPALLGRIFDPGFTTKGVGVGTGLGLALCHRLVDRHGGRLLVDSVVGQGSTFRVWLPSTGPTEAEATPP